MRLIALCSIVLFYSLSIAWSEAKSLHSVETQSLHVGARPGLSFAAERPGTVPLGDFGPGKTTRYIVDNRNAAWRLSSSVRSLAVERVGSATITAWPRVPPTRSSAGPASEEGN